MFSSIFKNKVSFLILGLYIIILLWWIKLNLSGIPKDEAYLFNWSYGLIPLIGAFYGIFKVPKIWGGYKSILGKGLILIALGLFGQWFGLQIWTYYNIILKVEAPYPSLADIGYFSLVPFYAFGALMFARAAGAKFSLRTLTGKIIALIIPSIMLLVAYGFFMKDLGFDMSNPIKTFFDFGYPLGEIIPVSIAMFTFFLSKQFLGGNMKTRILYLTFAFSFQFITEYAFLYAVTAQTYNNGGINDLLYATSYTIMSLGLISFRNYSS